MVMTAEAVPAPAGGAAKLGRQAGHPMALPCSAPCLDLHPFAPRYKWEASAGAYATHGHGWRRGCHVSADMGDFAHQQTGPP